VNIVQLGLSPETGIDTVRCFAFNEAVGGLIPDRTNFRPFNLEIVVRRNQPATGFDKILLVLNRKLFQDFGICFGSHLRRSCEAEFVNCSDCFMIASRQ